MMRYLEPSMARSLRWTTVSILALAIGLILVIFQPAHAASASGFDQTAPVATLLDQSPGAFTPLAGWPDCGFVCQAGDVDMTDLYIADADGNALPTCTVGTTVSAYLWGTFANNTGTTRYAVVVLADLYVNNVYQSSLQTNGTAGVCGGDIVLSGPPTSQRLTPLSWTCGDAVDLQNIVISWDTAQGETCVDFFASPSCTNRKTKCYQDNTQAARPLVEAEFTAADVCLGEPVLFTDQSAGGVAPITYAWNFGDSSTSTDQNPSHTYQAAGAYNVTLAIQDASTIPATDSEIKPVRVFAVPTADFLVAIVSEDDDTVTMQFTDNSTLPESDCTPTYSWNFGDGGTSTVANPVHTFQRSLSGYTVTMEVSACGCSSSTMFQVSAPLSVTLADFYVQQLDDHVLVTWETATEINNRGFNLYRSTTAAALGQQLNAALIPSQSPGNMQGYVYTFEDFDVAPSQTYWYTLEDLDFSGTTTQHGPLSIVIQEPTSVTLATLNVDGVPPSWGLAAATVALAALFAGLSWRKLARSK